jgi:ABC-2 type transport system ATP-binding protein
MDTILEAKNLTKQYEDFTLRDISLEIPAGCIAGFFGPNGAGKTTLIKLLANQVPPSGGALRVFGLSYAEREKEIKNRLGYVAQDPSFYADKSVRWTARFVAPAFAGWDGALFYQLLDDFKVNCSRKVRHLSRGQRTLFSIALALSHGADLLILDEPTSGLDVISRRNILDRLRAFVADGARSVIVSSHITDGLDEISEYVYFLNDGRLVLRAEKDELLSKWKCIHFRNGALGPSIVDRLADVRKQPFGTSALTRDFPEIRDQLAPAVACGDVRVENARLEDILIALVKGA